MRPVLTILLVLWVVLGPAVALFIGLTVGLRERNGH